jgi:hypothetical protein
LAELVDALHSKRSVERREGSSPSSGTKLKEMKTLYRPVSGKELDLIKESGMKKFPPRLPEQPIFYPVMNVEYARQITKDWNVPAYGNGYVLAFDVDEKYISKFAVENVGDTMHNELWVLSDQMDEFNENIIGDIRIIESYEN